ncbi:putative membrane protein [[Clostridium] sordellii ATCC 9714]|nr:putative membrane protein [[Clostridium] sordellii ATCC 9714] [Paeniclostridium sordellii ATCC 9714]
MLLINIKRGKKHVNIINILILMVAIILSGSRTALISTVLVIGLYLIFINNILKKVIYILEKIKNLLYVYQLE